MEHSTRVARPRRPVAAGPLSLVVLLGLVAAPPALSAQDSESAQVPLLEAVTGDFSRPVDTD